MGPSFQQVLIYFSISTQKNCNTVIFCLKSCNGREYRPVTVCAVMEELAHINKSTDNTKDAACQSTDNINASENTPAFKDPNSKKNTKPLMTRICIA